MNILFVSNLYPPNVFGGYERLCFEVATALQNRGHKITVLTSSYGENSEENYGHKVRRELFLFASEGNIYQPYECSETQKAKLEAENRKKLDAVVAEVDPDIIFVWNLYFFSADLLTKIEASKVQKCYLLTDNWLIAQLNSNFIGSYFTEKVFSNEAKKSSVLDILKSNYLKIRAKLFPGPLLMSGRAIFPSQFMRQLYWAAGFRFQSGEAICYHGVKFLHTANTVRASRNKLKKKGEVRLLFAGRVVNIKGVHTALESLHLVQQQLGQSSKVVLTIVGDIQDQSYFNDLKSIIVQNNLSGSVIFQEPVPEECLFELFQQHDIYLFPSLYEPFSLTLIHALESGIPTVASTVGGNVEIVENDKTGLLFGAGDPKDLAHQICRLACNDAFREKISDCAVNRAAKFTFNNMIFRIERELEEMLP